MNRVFREHINRFVRTMTEGYLPSASGEKIIHDPIWGSVVFHPWEVRLIDSPLFQRLRGISQVGLAESTYPAAHHTRFDHSLGTAAIASRMMEQLYADARERDEVCGVIGEEEIRLVRLAALLHDVGHCPFSHLSEAVYGKMPEFAEIYQDIVTQKGGEVSPSPHEIFSYLIIVSDGFVSFFHRHIRYPNVETEQDARALLQRAANMVIGAVNVDETGAKLSYLTKVLNGNFDADKLDYTQRDSYTAGIALTYGVERFLLKLVLCKTEKDGVCDYRLGITSDALSTVEELIFNRSMLYHYMYRHQKVLAAEAQMRDAIYALVRVGQITHPCDFLFLDNRGLERLFGSDRQPFSEEGIYGKTLQDLHRVFPRRTLFKRAFELGPDGLEEFRTREEKDPVAHVLKTLEKLEKEEEKREILNDLFQSRSQVPFPRGIERYVDFLRNCSWEEYVEERKTIASRIAAAYEREGRGVDFDAFDLSVSFQPPLISDLSMTITDKARRPVDTGEAIGRIHLWTETLNRSKWRGYLFVSPHMDRRLAGEVFKEYLKERCGV